MIIQNLFLKKLFIGVDRWTPFQSKNNVREKLMISQQHDAFYCTQQNVLWQNGLVLTCNNEMDNHSDDWGVRRCCLLKKKLVGPKIKVEVI